MKIKNLLLLLAFVMPVVMAGAQSRPAGPSEISVGKYWGLSKPLRDLPVMSAADWKEMAKKAKKELNEGLEFRSYPYAATALPRGEDAAWQKFMGNVHNPSAPLVNFDGPSSPYYPPDCNGTVGPNHFMQTINSVYAIYNKAGALVAGPTNMNLLFGNVPGATRNDGDPIILYDEQADRWFATEFSIPGSGTNYILLAVSTTNDPTGTWHQYSFPVASMPDYPKFSVWRDGYYMGDNNGGSTDIYVFQRDSILVGATAKSVGFHNTWRPSSVDGFMCVPPIDNDGAFAPAGSPGLYIAFNDDAFGGGTDQLWIYELAVDWNVTTNSTFNRVQQIDVEPFSSNFGNNWDNVSQKGVSQKVDAIPQVIMNVPQYRNFGAYQTIVCCHTVNLGTPPSNNHAGIRWYELRKTAGSWSVRQQSTYAPDADSRWMGSIMLNGASTIGLGYSVSSANIYPSIRYCGQSAVAYAAGNGTLDIAEDTIINGQNSQTGYNRWGDYSLLSVDPTDDNTFWFTSEYIGAGGSRKTRIASFKYALPPSVVTLDATNLTGVTATLNGTVNPNGAPSTGYFYWGTSMINLPNSTPVDSLGSGTSVIPIASIISGLNPATTYYYRVAGTNPAGAKYGAVKSFSTIQPNLSVYPPNQSVGEIPGETIFEVTSNIPWLVSSSATWCVPTSGGTGNDTIHAVFTENTGTQSRVATLTVSGIGVTPVAVTVTQAGITPQLIVTPDNQNVISDAVITNFTVLCNTSWTATSDAAWCAVTPSGIGNGSITATVQANTTVTQRIAHISVLGIGVGPVVVTVTQAGQGPSLLVTPSTQNVSSLAGSINYQVTSNTSWTAQSDSVWCTVTASGTGEGTIVANYTANAGRIARTSHITVTAAGLIPVIVNLSQAKSTAGISEADAGKVKIYPNPNKGIFNIAPADGSKSVLTIEVEDMSGKSILKKQLKGQDEYQVDLSSAPAGTYNIVIRSETYLVTRKIVILR